MHYRNILLKRLSKRNRVQQAKNSCQDPGIMGTHSLCFLEIIWLNHKQQTLPVVVFWLFWAEKEGETKLCCYDAGWLWNYFWNKTSFWWQPIWHSCIGLWRNSKYISKELRFKVRTLTVMAVEIRRVNCLTDLIKCAEGRSLVLKEEFKRQLKRLLENSCALWLDMLVRWEIAMTLNQSKGARSREKATMKKCIHQPLFWKFPPP